jgi:hypothetical protein
MSVKVCVMRDCEPDSGGDIPQQLNGYSVQEALFFLISTVLRGLSSRANYTDWATEACWRN